MSCFSWERVDMNFLFLDILSSKIQSFCKENPSKIVSTSCCFFRERGLVYAYIEDIWDSPSEIIMKHAQIFRNIKKELKNNIHEIVYYFFNWYKITFWFRVFINSWSFIKPSGVYSKYFTKSGLYVWKSILSTTSKSILL